MYLIDAAHPRYDEYRALFNGMIDKRPGLIARCAAPGDVAAILQRARAGGHEVAVRAGGHSVAGMSSNDGGVVIDVRPMKSIEIDPKARRARVGAGVTWGEFDRAAQQHGLATTGGRVSSTGVAGLTLGGGSGWLERCYGLACDNLVSVDLVTADGRLVTASAVQHPELFWALHGGGGNFGVATSFEFSLHPVGPIVLAGLMMWPSDAAVDVARTYRDTAFDAPDELGSALVFVTAPAAEFVPAHLQGTTVAAIAALWAGRPDEGHDVLKIFRDLGPAADLVAPMPYADFQRLVDEPPGLLNYWTADYLDDCPDGAVDVLVRSGLRRKSPRSQQLLLPWGGAVAQIPEFATPLANRSVRWLAHPFAIWPDPADTEANIAWARALRRDIAGYVTGGIYLNFIGNEGPDRVRAAYGEANYGRLAAVKAEWDPDNVFRGNQNIIPAGLSAPPSCLRSGCPVRARGSALPAGARGGGNLGQRNRRAQARSVASHRPVVAGTGPDPQEAAEVVRDVRRWRGAGGARWSGPSPRTPDVPAISSRSRPRLTEGSGRVRRAHGHRLASPRRTAASPLQPSGRPLDIEQLAHVQHACRACGADVEAWTCGIMGAARDADASTAERRGERRWRRRSWSWKTSANCVSWSAPTWNGPVSPCCPPSPERRR
jgi:FAD/FMN-containing dehydrogenase